MKPIILHRNIFLFVGILILSACSSPYVPDEQQPYKEPEVQIASELFEEVGAAGTTKTYRFHTNDPQYWSQQGYTLWTVWGEENPPSFEERTVTMWKSAGTSYAGYGLVICQGMKEVEGDEVPVMLTVMINNDRQYCIGKVIGGKYSAVHSWAVSDFLRSGQGVANTLKISQEPEGFLLWINDTKEIVFVDHDDPVVGLGRNGYIVVIAPKDRFPKQEVDVYFTEER
jgi:hypothetical protein